MHRANAYRSDFSSALSDMLNGSRLQQRGGPLFTSHLKGATAVSLALRPFADIKPFGLSETPMGGIDDASLRNLNQLLDTAYDTVADAAIGNDVSAQVNLYTNMAMASQSYLSDLQEKLAEFPAHRHANSRAILDQLSKLNALCQNEVAGLSIDRNQIRGRYPLVSPTLTTEADIDFPPYA